MSSPISPVCSNVEEHNISPRLIYLLSALAPLALQAQVGAGSIQGTVTDPTGAVIPNAAVSSDNLETGISLRTLSNRAGFFIFPSAQPGKYRVTAESLRMQKWEGQVQLQTGQDAVVSPVLAVGATTTKMTVAGDVTPLVTTTSPTPPVSSSARASRNYLPTAVSSKICSSDYPRTGNRNLGKSSSSSLWTTE